uniref:Zinc fingers and homeoboxes protein 2-like n=1 Tax=Cynoglossus semilaevis TaxID=244447 RepID=A0A3P8WSN4_CYNSE
MSSRRKSSNPCMVRVVNDLPEEQQEPEEAVDMERSTETSPEENQNSEPSEQEEQLEYECKYCPFVTQNLNDFKDHVDSSHPYVILNPLYLCAPCNFNTKKFDSLSEHNSARHPGETNFKFKRIKTNNQTVLEQTIESKDKSAESEVGDGHGESSAGEVLRQGRGLKSSLDGLIQKDQITAVNINGTVIIPEPTILQGLSHVTPLLQLPPNLNSVPKIAVPLNTTKYNPSLDDNLTLITSFNKFPYPTHAELSWLTAASKHPEEQIKVWFTTQRLKQGITWSPEEVEEARKKMFNGSIPPNHHMFTSQPSSPISVPSTKVSKQPVVHTTVEHPGQVRTVVSNGIAVGIAGTNSSAAAVIGSCHTLKRPLQSHMSATFGPESKRPIMAVAPHPAPLPGFPLEGNKGLEQHGADLKTCYNRGDQVLTPLTEANGTSLPDSDWVHNNGVVHLDGDEPHPDFQQKSSVLTQFPLLERMKGKTAEQLKILEENFLRNSFPTHSEVDNLSASTRLSHQEIESWFVERRALRDNLEQALLNSMGTKRNGAGGLVASRLPMVPTPNGRWLALLKGDIAQTRWPSPEEFSHLEGRTGLTRTDLAHWFNESRLQTDSSVDLSGLFHGSVMNGGQRASLRPSEKTPSSNVGKTFLGGSVRKGNGVGFSVDSQCRRAAWVSAHRAGRQII